MGIRLLSLLLLSSLWPIVGCTQAATPPGYSGGVPSGAGQRVAKGLAGKTFTDSRGVFGGGKWQVESFAVIPNPVTGKGPVVRLLRPGAPPLKSYDPGARTDVKIIPLETDGDVADLYRRITGSKPEKLEGTLSSAYQSSLDL